MSHREEAPGKTQDTLARLCLSAGLGTPRGPPGRAGGSVWVADPTPFPVQAEVTLKTNFFATRDMLTHFMPIIKAGGRVVNVSSFVGSSTLNQCSPALQERFHCSEGHHGGGAGGTDAEIRRKGSEGRAQGGRLARSRVRTIQDRTDGTKQPSVSHLWRPGTSLALSMILARRLSKERPNDG
ncbi:hypothetical protein L3Q82_012083, partial [Scortum barcoo]